MTFSIVSSSRRSQIIFMLWWPHSYAMVPPILHPFWPYLVPLPLSLSLLTFKTSELVTFLLLSFNTTAKETDRIARVYVGSQFQRAKSPSYQGTMVAGGAVVAGENSYLEPQVGSRESELEMA